MCGQYLHQSMIHIMYYDLYVPERLGDEVARRLWVMAESMSELDIEI
jgi:hypothetical protein